jgi:hypothetical protein
VLKRKRRKKKRKRRKWGQVEPKKKRKTSPKTFMLHEKNMTKYPFILVDVVRCFDYIFLKK